MPRDHSRFWQSSHDDSRSCEDSPCCTCSGLEATRQAQAAVETFLATGDAATPANISFREGDARQMILDIAAERDADLLAVGAHGRSGLTHVLLGSVAEG